MNKKLLAHATCLMMFLAVAAQPQPVGHLTIFSEDGDKFFLILNGEKQNNVAQTNLRVEDLTQDYYNAKVIFEDQTLGEISKNYLAIADANAVKQDVTYKIKKNKNNGKMTLNFFSMTPVVQGYVPPSNVYVVRTGQPQPPATIVTTTPASTTVTQTTTTTTGTGGTVGANVNMGGINVGVTINDPLLNGTVTQTTTTTHTTTNASMNTTTTQPANVGCRGTYPMGSSDFSSALASVKNQSFDETRLKSAKQIAGGNCLSATQIADICKVFGFEATKLDFAKFAYDRCTEPQNYFKVNNVFGFSSSVDELNDYITGR
ncbi:MAG: DUF4476 domain-containing protein [Chitinophagales bacterium]|nr:DUF4476 domain-containing protein [Chitinophagales bacterium]